MKNNRCNEVLEQRFSCLAPCIVRNMNSGGSSPYQKSIKNANWQNLVHFQHDKWNKDGNYKSLSSECKVCNLIVILWAFSGCNLKDLTECRCWNLEKKERKKKNLLNVDTLYIVLNSAALFAIDISIHTS